MTSGGNKWTLTQAVFDKFLEQLDLDSQRAAEKYEQIRGAIIKYFECRGSAFSRELADETINRVARKLAGGVEIKEANLTGYFYGVARNVLREHLRNPETTATPVESLSRRQHPASDTVEAGLRASESTELDRQLECLEECVSKLAPPARALVMSYYEWEKDTKIEYRKQLAEALGLSANSLRIRVHRIREKLEKCLIDCIDRPARGEM